MSDLWPILVGLLASVALYAFQKWRDRQERIKERHHEIYVKMVEAICALANAQNLDGEGKEDALSNYATAKMKFAIVASENAMRRFIEFDRRVTSGKKVPHDEFDRLLAKFMREVRIENLGQTNLTDEEIIVITPFGRSLEERKTP